MGIQMAVALANIFMAKIEMQVLDKGARLESLHRRNNLSCTPTDLSSSISLNKQIIAT